jgi:hypothetical protein
MGNTSSNASKPTIDDFKNKLFGITVYLLSKELVPELKFKSVSECTNGDALPFDELTNNDLIQSAYNYYDSKLRYNEGKNIDYQIEDAISNFILKDKETMDNFLFEFHKKLVSNSNLKKKTQEYQNLSEYSANTSSSSIPIKSSRKSKTSYKYDENNYQNSSALQPRKPMYSQTIPKKQSNPNLNIVTDENVLHPVNNKHYCNVNNETSLNYTKKQDEISNKSQTSMNTSHTSIKQSNIQQDGISNRTQASMKESHTQSQVSKLNNYTPQNFKKIQRNTKLKNEEIDEQVLNESILNNPRVENKSIHSQKQRNSLKSPIDYNEYIDEENTIIDCTPNNSEDDSFNNEIIEQNSNVMKYELDSDDTEEEQDSRESIENDETSIEEF